jgi:hypothetical protein
VLLFWVLCGPQLEIPNTLGVRLGILGTIGVKIKHIPKSRFGTFNRNKAIINSTCVDCLMVLGPHDGSLVSWICPEEAIYKQTDSGSPPTTPLTLL